MAAQDKYADAITHYNKSLIAMKMLFDGEEKLIKDQEGALKYIVDIDVPVCLNLGLAYLKTQ